MFKSITINFTTIFVLTTIATASESTKKYIPIIMDSIISFVVIDNGPDLYEAVLTSNDDVVIVQKSTKLMWVNEPDVSKGKCKKIHKATFNKDFLEAKGFCKSSSFGNFAGFSNWRTPTSSELKIFIKATKNMHINYDAPCNKLLALKDNQTNNESSNSSYTTVSTRFNNTYPIGIDLNSIKPNIGLRCVRTITEPL